MMKTVYRRLCAVMLLALCFAPAMAKANVFSDQIKLIVESLESSIHFEPCSKGDRGTNVLNIKEHLQTLGYYRPTASFGDDYNATMVQRVELFQENNCLKVTGEVDSETVNKLKESNPVPGEYYNGSWTEPAVTLIIPRNTWGQWVERNESYIDFHIKVKNISLSRTVKAIEFLVYTKNVWGDELISEEDPRTYTVETTFKPGEMGYTGYIPIPDSTNTKEVNIAIYKVRYTDGTTETVSEPKYYFWNINWD